MNNSAQLPAPMQARQWRLQHQHQGTNRPVETALQAGTALVQRSACPRTAPPPSVRAQSRWRQATTLLRSWGLLLPLIALQRQQQRLRAAHCLPVDACAREQGWSLLGSKP